SIGYYPIRILFRFKDPETVLIYLSDSSDIGQCTYSQFHTFFQPARSALIRLLFLRYAAGTFSELSARRRYIRSELAPYRSVYPALRKSFKKCVYLRSAPFSVAPLLNLVH